MKVKDVPWGFQGEKKKFPFSSIGAPDRAALSFFWTARCEGTNCHGCFANIMEVRTGRGTRYSHWVTMFARLGTSQILDFLVIEANTLLRISPFFSLPHPLLTLALLWARLSWFSVPCSTEAPADILLLNHTCFCCPMFSLTTQTFSFFFTLHSRTALAFSGKCE